MVTKMLESAIEIEGLLRIIRDGNPLPEVYQLLKDKTARLSEEARLFNPMEENTAFEIGEEPLQDESSAAGTNDEDDIMLAFDVEEEDAKEPEIDMVEEAGNPKGTPAKSFKRKTKLKSVFSLNDRFLYARELFDGNMKMFDSTLDFIEDIEEYSLIEDYFYSELEWDPENLHVATFMEILRPQFRE